MKRSALKRGSMAWLRAPRKPLPAVSAKRRREETERAKVRKAVLARDGYRCRLLALDSETHDCHGSPLTVHHVAKASAGGPYTAANLLTICAYGNGLIEDRPAWAWQLGLVQRSGDDPEDTWRRLWVYGLSRFPYPGSRP